MKRKNIYTLLILAFMGLIITYSCDPANKIVYATIDTREILTIGSTSAYSGGNITDAGNALIMMRGVCYSTSPNPDLNDDFTEDGRGAGEYGSYMEDLLPDTDYYVRAYAVNSRGTSYGEELTFRTRPTTVLATVITNEATDITSTGASCTGEVTHDGNSEVIRRGLCWSTSHLVSVNNSHIDLGSGLGEFGHEITGLASGTKYFVKAYAYNTYRDRYGRLRSQIAYGNPQTFTTLSSK